jgi:hypothetical protein
MKRDFGLLQELCKQFFNDPQKLHFGKGKFYFVVRNRGFFYHKAKFSFSKTSIRKVSWEMLLEVSIKRARERERERERENVQNTYFFYCSL